MSTLCRGCRGFEGGCNALDNFFPRETCCIFCLIFRVASICVSIVGWIFGTWFFADGFLFPVNQLGLLTNPSHWVRFLDVFGSYMYIVL
jgi:hypothetical protein